MGCSDPTGEVGVDLLKKLKNIPRIIYNTTSFVNNYTSPLSGQSKFSSESDYKKQYTTISENEAANLRVVSIVGQLPGALGIAATVLGTGASTNSTNNEEVVVFNQRLSFIDGAEKEIERIDEVSKWLKDDPFQKGFVDYLSDQKQILQNEINKNKEYDKKEQKLDNGYNRSHSEESWAKGTDYVNFYEKHIKNGQENKDE